ncbi:zinc finger protein castor homolog 1-like, partial [Limulus polyphemus]|uniref:Zinc finger protein castor homolog 1-like n=1 Tax=Limulus polyphemus TaxID=6850 RepID=A0ABM1SDK6_LIMPO
CVTNSKSKFSDYTGFVKRYTSYYECGNSYCKDVNYREHYHCMDCNCKVFLKKEEIIRHCKWHKKRDEFLQQGFMRYSSTDSCSDRFTHCSHNGKQTHYHCLKEGCDKVYTSTSDVQVHGNCHRKDSAIIREGFHRYRATEDCGSYNCPFGSQRTTHFHCRRPGCSYTFKNKSDIEKHKAYHIKDEQLIRDGFKKFMKHVHCTFSNCKFSRVSNHIHCIRPGCTYVLHSTGQLYSHKRKHDRKESDLLQRKFSQVQGISNTSVPDQLLSDDIHSNPGLPPPLISGLHVTLTSPLSIQFGPTCNYHGQVATAIATRSEGLESTTLTAGSEGIVTTTLTAGSEGLVSTAISGGSASISQSIRNNCATQLSKFDAMLTETKLLTSLNYATSLPHSPFHLPDSTTLINQTQDAVAIYRTLLKQEGDESWKEYIKLYDLNECTMAQCDEESRDHYHCFTDNCCLCFRATEFNRVQEHARNHGLQDLITEMHYVTAKPGDDSRCPPGCNLSSETHYHCIWEGCQAVINGLDQPFQRLDHYKTHEYSYNPKIYKNQYPGKCIYLSFGQSTRKRGRPPKNNLLKCSVSSSFSPNTNLPIAITTTNENYPVQTNNNDQFHGVFNVSPLTTVANITSITTSKASNQVYSPSQTSSSSLLKTNTSQSSTSVTPQYSASGQSSYSENLCEFVAYNRNSPCPDHLCLYYGQHHFHCVHPRCYFVTNCSNALFLHSTDFHVNFDILEDFLFFDRNVDCRLSSCPSNKFTRHFHCARPGCFYSFVRYSSMSKHDEKHRELIIPSSSEDKQNGQKVKPELELACNSNPENVNIITSSESFAKTADTFTNKTTVVKARGTYYPLSAFYEQNQNSKASIAGLPVLPVSNTSYQDVDTSQSSCTEQLSTQPAGHPATCTERKNVLLASNCGYPFCQNKKEHFHCGMCNQTFFFTSDVKTHICEHLSGFIAVLSSRDVEDPVEQDDSSGDNLKKYRIEGCFNNDQRATEETRISQQGCVEQSSQLMLSGVVSKDLIPVNVSLTGKAITVSKENLLNSMKRCAVSSFEGYTVAKKVRSQSLHVLKDDPVPEGYVRYRFNENCGFSFCGYREHQTHFHCLRKDCGYSFCDKTRFVQHTARHERLDTLMGSDFRQFRVNINCGYPDCSYMNTSGTITSRYAHFHCLKCEFMCSDTNKLVAHRRQHAKLDNINAAGFRKFTSSQQCNFEGCTYNQKQTHYHCLKCHCAVVGLSQISSHGNRHIINDLE